MSWRKAALPLVLVLYFAGAVVWLARDRRAAGSGAPDFSALDTSPRGLSLVYHYLQKRNHAVLLTRSIDAADLPPRAVVFRVAPSTQSIGALLAQQSEDDSEEREKHPATKTKAAKPRPKSLLAPGEEEWIRGGGRVVFAVNEEYGPLQPLGSPVGAIQKVFPLWPSLATLPRGDLRIIRGAEGTHAIFVAGAESLLLRRVIGKGDVIIFAAPEMWQNRRVGAESLALLDTLAESRPVYFDEVVHGVRSDAGIFELMKRWGLGPFLLLLGIGFTLRMWRNGRRVGNAEREPEDTRSEAVDLVDSLARLYERSLSHSEMIDLYRRIFVATVASRTALRGEALTRRVAELAPDLPPSHGRDEGTDQRRSNSDLPRALFERQLNIINQAFGRLDLAKRR